MPERLRGSAHMRLTWAPRSTNSPAASRRRRSPLCSIPSDPGAGSSCAHAPERPFWPVRRDRKSTRLNSSHMSTSYAVFCLKKKRGFSQTTYFVRRRQIARSANEYGGRTAGASDCLLTLRRFTKSQYQHRRVSCPSSTLFWLSTVGGRPSIFFFNDTPPTEIYTLSLHDALPI